MGCPAATSDHDRQDAYSYWNINELQIGTDNYQTAQSLSRCSSGSRDGYGAGQTIR